MILSGLIVPSCLIVFALVWGFTSRLDNGAVAKRIVEKVVALPPWLWIAVGSAAFTIPVFEYWITAKSHGNALAGYLPWADATEYFQCAQTFLLGIDGPDHCGKRPYYIALFADLLWLGGNDLQIALLLQALIVGLAASLFTNSVSKAMGSAAALGCYATLFAFAAALCSGLVMTENAGLLLGILAIMLLLHSTPAPSTAPFLAGTALLAAAMSARPGPLFVLPALGLWYLAYGGGPLRRRVLIAVVAGVVSVLAMALVASPALIAGGTFGSTHSNLSYSLYGLVAGGKGWLQVTIDHPEIYERTATSQTDKVYALVLEKLWERPDLALYGYMKGVAKYFDALFRYTSEFDPLRLVLIVIWALGVTHALRHWRERRGSLPLFMLAGILVSSPFLIYDGHNRAFASVAPVDALFVAMGIGWVVDRLAKSDAATNLRPPLISSSTQAVMLLIVLVFPVVMLAAISPSQPFRAIAAPDCPGNAKAAVVRPAKGSPVLRLVGEQEQRSIFPLRVRAEHFASRMHKSVHRKEELALPPGSKLVWGIRLDSKAPGKRIYFNWPGELPPAGRAAVFCIEFAPGTHVGTATSIENAGR